MDWVVVGATVVLVREVEVVVLDVVDVDVLVVVTSDVVVSDGATGVRAEPAWAGGAVSWGQPLTAMATPSWARIALAANSGRTRDRRRLTAVVNRLNMPVRA